MTVKVGAHYDGTTLVLDEAIDLPMGTRVRLTIEPDANGDAEAVLPVDTRTIEERMRVIKRAFSHGRPGVNLPDEATRRESIYGDDSR